MINSKLKLSTPHKQERELDFDNLMANLFTLITHHSLTQCQSSIPSIVERLEALCNHSEIELYPAQLKVLAKMRQLWKTQLFKTQTKNKIH